MDKLLKSPDSTYMEWAVLTVVALAAIDEGLEPCVVVIVLGGTPIDLHSKTSNDTFLQVQ